MGEHIAARDGDGKTHGFKLVAQDDQNAMFISVVDLCEVPQRSSVRHIRSAIRLNVLDLCKSRTTDEWCDFSLGDICKVTRTDADGKKRIACSLGSAAVQNGELLNEVIESRAQVVNAITDDQGQGRVKRFALRTLNGKVLPELPFKLVFIGNGKSLSVRRFKDDFDSFVQIKEVVLRSVNLGAYPCQ